MCKHEENMRLAATFDSEGTMSVRAEVIAHKKDGENPRPYIIM